MTRVQELKDEIYWIQSNCSHRWVKDHEVTPIESLVQKTYIGHTVGSIKVGEYPPVFQEKDFRIDLTCEKCSKAFRGHISSTCPKCFVKLEDRGLVDREEYFGIEYLYYRIRLRVCTKCMFTVACDEWDQ